MHDDHSGQSFYAHLFKLIFLVWVIDDFQTVYVWILFSHNPFLERHAFHYREVLMYGAFGVFWLNVKYDNRCHTGPVPPHYICAFTCVLIQVYQRTKIIFRKKFYVPLNWKNNIDFLVPKWLFFSIIWWVWDDDCK